MNKPKKVLILGSGALKIGEAGEFDYSGSQAIKAFKEEGVQTVLINPNIATIQTSDFLADRVYFLPVNPYFVEKVIAKEKPDSITVSFGGQTALNCGVALYRQGVLKKYKVQVLGTPIESVILTEDRDKFANHLRKIRIPTPISRAAKSMSESVEYAQEIGYPVMIRAAFALGGQKSGIAKNEAELRAIVTNALSFSPQVLIEKYLHHFKEVEYEVVRDAYDNCVTVCNMENFDPLGIHTGESIVVAPSQTLTNHEYHFLRKKAIEIVRSVGIVGECNVQYALNPNPKNGELDFYVIEINARLSRSSALASKATGYPLAYVAAKLATGKNLTEIKNQVTKVTQACFEPALDYVVVKIPRWDLEKFRGVEEKIGSSMKSVGEVMAIGRTFEEAIQKAVRMLDISAEGVTDNSFQKKEEDVLHYVRVPTPKRLFAVAEALARNISIKEIHNLTGIDPWFLYRIKEIVSAEQGVMKKKTLSSEEMRRLKQLGISDLRIGKLIGKSELEVRSLRKKLHVLPSIFQIDTLGGEMPAKTNYLYVTYLGSHNDVEPLKKSGVMVLGSGTYRIGSSVEFDWTCVNTARSLRKYGKKSILINCNPETVSTDYDISDRLYFEELSFERVTDIYEFEQAQGIIISVGGQTPNNLAQRLSRYGVHLLGTSAENIDRAEDRSKFSQLLDDLKILQPEWNKFTTEKQAIEFAQKVGYPVLIRPSYVLSGSAMSVCYTEEELKTFIEKAVYVSKEHPITVSKFMSEAKEIELDAVAEKGEIKVFAISEHIEHAGVHSGDASIVNPSQRLYLQTENKVQDIAEKLAAALHITGPFNIQYLAKGHKVYVIEINLRASRTFPMISKASRVNFAEIIVDALYGKSKKQRLKYTEYMLVKVAQFSFSRLEGADPTLHVEMSSTGEAACFGYTLPEAFLKSELSVGAKIPQKGIFLSLGGDENKVRFLESSLRLKKLHVPIYATEGTAAFLKRNGIKTKRLYKIHDKKTPNVLTYFQSGKIDVAINFPEPKLGQDIGDHNTIRRSAVDHNIYLLTNRQKAAIFVEAITELELDDLEIRAWDEYK
jgi:carbamoyl-phosphate synthase large subunit